MTARVIGRATLVFAAPAFVWFLVACTTSRGDVGRGWVVADRWCAECHRVAADQPSGSRAGHILPPTLEAPSFMAVAARPEVDVSYLQRFMRELHLPMPTYRLDKAEQESVIDYILSLKAETR